MVQTRCATEQSIIWMHMPRPSPRTGPPSLEVWNVLCRAQGSSVPWHVQKAAQERHEARDACRQVALSGCIVRCSRKGVPHSETQKAVA
eukprot:1153217-Pelagomonas_calceolata.AAC.3